MLEVNFCACSRSAEPSTIFVSQKVEEPNPPSSAMKKRLSKDSLFFMVGVKGLEPSTSRSQTARASQLRHTPIGVKQCNYSAFALNFLVFYVCSHYICDMSHLSALPTKAENTIRHYGARAFIQGNVISLLEYKPT